jgi:glycyl-tRNA synthetase
MHDIYELNGVPFFNEADIKLRRYLETYFADGMRTMLEAQNYAWRMVQIEAPTLTPVELLNPNYTADDIWMQGDHGSHKLALRPETTPGSYAYAEHMLIAGDMPPICVWQAGKSYRREQDQATKHCRYKEFYQQEFQCIYSDTTKNDYQASMIDGIAKMIGDVVGLPTRVVDSDRLPAYSKRTLDVEVNNGDKWMEVCSVSLRTDFTFEIQRGTKQMKCLVLEVAIGLDRCIYNIGQRNLGVK